MNDKQLLELAAKAAGQRPNDIIYGKNPWNPLENDADALRLAVQLGIFVNLKTIEDGPDPYAATRRGIVEKAADIGKTISVDGKDQKVMPTDYIIELARQAGIQECFYIHEELAKFAALVRAETIEECAKRSDAYAYMSPNFEALSEELRGMKNIIELAKEAGFVIWGEGERKGMIDWGSEYDKELEKFAAIVRAEREWIDLTDDEIEEVAKECVNWGGWISWKEFPEKLIAAFKEKNK